MVSNDFCTLLKQFVYVSLHVAKQNIDNVSKMKYYRNRANKLKYVIKGSFSTSLKLVFTFYRSASYCLLYCGPVEILVRVDYQYTWLVVKDD